MESWNYFITDGVRFESESIRGVKRDWWWWRRLFDGRHHCQKKDDKRKERKMMKKNKREDSGLKLWLLHIKGGFIVTPR